MSHMRFVRRRSPGKMRVPWLCAAMAIAGGLLAACSSGNGDAVLPQPLAATAERLVVDGQAFPVSIIRVEFDSEVIPLESDVPFASSIELRVPTPDLETGELSTDIVFVQSANVLAEDPTLVDLRVLEVVPAGSVLAIRGSAFAEDSEETLEVEVGSDVDPLLALLATAAFEPPSSLLASGATAPVTDADRDEAAQRAALEGHLSTRGAEPGVAEAALATFDSIPPEVVTSPKLRAAIAGLTGTFAEPAIAHMLTADNCTGLPAARIAFEPPPDAPELLARVTHAEDGARIFSFSPVLEGERIEHLMALLAHEPVHCDSIDGRFEEISATAFDAFLYIELLAADPTIAESGTRLARELNLDAVAFINSGRALPESVGILQTNGMDRALPSTTSTAASFGQLIVDAYPDISFNESPEEGAAAAYVAVLGQRVGAEPGEAFDLVYLDELLARAMPTETMVAAILALGLQTPG